MKPGNGYQLTQLRSRGMVPAGLIVVSFIGDLGLDNFTLYATPGRRYDWRLIKDLSVCAFINDDNGTGADLRPIADQAKQGEAYVWLATKNRGAWIYPDDDIVGTQVVHYPAVRSITWTEHQNESFYRAIHPDQKN